MSSKLISPTLSYDRLGWYWQPKSWLENMSPADTKKATVKSTGVKKQGKALLENAVKQEKANKQNEHVMRSLVDSLEE